MKIKRERDWLKPKEENMKKPDVENCPCCGESIEGCCASICGANGKLLSSFLSFSCWKCECSWIHEQHKDRACALGCRCRDCVTDEESPDKSTIPTAEEIEMREAKEACRKYKLQREKMKQQKKISGHPNSPVWYWPIELSTKHRIIGERMGWIEKE